jgi:type IV pilus assembly protein PilB
MSDLLSTTNINSLKFLDKSDIRLISFLEDSNVFNASMSRFFLEQSEMLNKSPLDFIDEENIQNILSELLGYTKLDISALNNLDQEVIKLIPSGFAREHICIPVNINKKILGIALFNPFQSEAIIELEKITGYSVKTYLATRKNILNAINTHYSDKSAGVVEKLNDIGLNDLLVNENIEIFNTEEISLNQEFDIDEHLKMTHDDAPIVKMVNFIISQGIKTGCSDIHIEPTEDYLQVRFRVDGVLNEFIRLQKWLQNALISRIKIIGKLDITEKRIPQDGRIRINFEGKNLDLRVSSLPANYGETIVLRILDQSKMNELSIDNLNLSEENHNKFFKAIKQPQGIILVTGPTGSGKSSTLYSLLMEILSPKINIVTVEDPIEYTVKGINQVNVDVKAGLTFASALRAILRQDPDVIMIGEIRDAETAEIAFHASMTGHLVLSTLHTNNSTATITRLIDLGITPYLIASGLILVVAQRLVRKNCRFCLSEYVPDKIVLEGLKISDENFVFKKGKGCSNCRNTGYKGRIGIYELLEPDQEIRNIIRNSTSEELILNNLKEKKLEFLRDSAINKIKAGLTTPDEVLRIIGAN